MTNGTTLRTGSQATGDLFAVITPRNIALFLEPPGGSSRNTWSTRVAEVHLTGDRVRVLLMGIDHFVP
ncbi:MAG: hypothetical protein IVW52_19085 [Acidimicrobiales bacterium]|nr:hypothetical protein [Acidimicrobiales bacterium]